MSRLSLLLLLLLLVLLVRSDWRRVCAQQEAGAGLYLQAEVVLTLREEGQEVVLVVDSEEREVVVQCLNPRGAAELYDHRGLLLAENSSESFSNRLQYRLWGRNYSGLWGAEKTVRCNTFCQLRLLEVKEGTSCHLESVRDETNLWCNVRGWLSQAFNKVQPGESECNRSDYDFKTPNYEFFLWSQERDQWSGCSKHDIKRVETGQDRNVTFIRCGLSDRDHDLLVKMEKSHPRQSVTGFHFHDENQCSESAYFLVQQAEQETGWYRQVLVFTAGVSLVVTLTAGLLVGLRSRRKKTEDKSVVSAADSSVGINGVYIASSASTRTRCSLILQSEEKTDWLDLTDQQKTEMLHSAVLDGDNSRSESGTIIGPEPSRYCALIGLNLGIQIKIQHAISDL